MAGLFDKVIGNIARGADSVKEGSKIFVEKAKINSRIQEVVREKEQLVKNMGNLVFNLQSNGEIHIDQCVGICDEITQLNRQIESLQEQVRALDAVNVSYGDGQAVQPPMESGIRCQCGFVNKETAKFCAKCGQPLT